MENNLELKKEFEDLNDEFRMIISHMQLGYEDNMPLDEFDKMLGLLVAHVSKNFVPKSEYDSVCEMFQYEIAGRNDLTIKNIELTEQIAELKAENEKYKQRNCGKVVVEYLDANSYEEYGSFQEAKEAILESFTDKDEGIHPDIESIKVLQEIYKIEVPENPDGTYSIHFVPIKVSDELAQARKEKLGYFIFKDACGERVNKDIYDKYDGFKQVLPIETDRIKAEARKEERARIISTIQLMKFNPVLDATEERINGILSHIANIIEPQQSEKKI